MRLGKYLLIAALIAAIPAVFLSYVALQHNPQGEFADTFTGDWTPALFQLFFVSWAIFALFVVPVALAILLVRLRRD